MRVFIAALSLVLFAYNCRGYDTAQCRYVCDDPTCNVFCDPMCEAPVCNIPQQYAAILICEIRCPPSSCLDKNSCPSCTIKANNATLSAICARHCSAPVCACSCRKPTDCPVPKCQLMCEKHSCESSLAQVTDDEPVPAQENENTDVDPVDEIAQEPTLADTLPRNRKSNKNKINANDYYYDDDGDNPNDDNGAWIFFWVFISLFFVCFLAFAFSFSYGYGPYYW